MSSCQTFNIIINSTVFHLQSCLERCNGVSDINISIALIQKQDQKAETDAPQRETKDKKRLGFSYFVHSNGFEFEMHIAAAPGLQKQK